jgi:hypothetical protein
MTKLIVFCATVIVFGACKKDPAPAPPPPTPHPKMRYTNLNSRPVPFGGLHRIDMDGDNNLDVTFSTILVGDPLAEVDKEQYIVTTPLHASLLVNDQEETPVFNLGDSIKIEGHRQSLWYNASSVILAQKIIGFSSEHWEGNWRNTERKYAGLQIEKNGLRYNGWVELSFSTTLNQIILHRAAIAEEAGKPVRAGY